MDGKKKKNEFATFDVAAKHDEQYIYEYEPLPLVC